ncbi:MAG: hypothetical protein GXP27_17535 [Planctomycetes bacterium]|nr:hypothetical protein [Planctomycetota bacterium]
MPSERIQSPAFPAVPPPISEEEPEAAGLGQVSVIHGIYTHSFPFAGLTVRRARQELSERFNISPEAMAVVDGNPVDEDTILCEGQTLNFVQHAGEKGSTRLAAAPRVAFRSAKRAGFRGGKADKFKTCALRAF